jgi:uncharacterized protein (UPF0147 family)
MEADKIRQLLYTYNSGDASADDLKAIEALIEQGKIQLEDLEGLASLESQIVKLEVPEVPSSLDMKFHAMLRQEKGVEEGSWKNFFSWQRFAPRLALAAVTLLIGLAVGYLIHSPVQKEEQIVKLSNEIGDLNNEIGGLKEMMMLSLLEKESATDRLRAVSLTQDMSQASNKVTEALLQTLNNDENVNVRLAALDALRPYSKNDKVREALIRSISLQKSPLVQIALAELMVALQEKDAVKELKKILEDKETPSDIRKKIQESIKVI